MGQYFFLSLFAATLIVGAYAYLAPLQKPISPMKFVMDTSGYSVVESRNVTRAQKLELSTNKGLLQIRHEMDDLAVVQDRIFDSLNNQQEILNNSSNQAADILSKAQNTPGLAMGDLLNLKALAAQIQSEKSLLISHGDNLVALNNKIAANRQWVADQVDLGKFNSGPAINTFQQNYSSLKNEAQGLLEKVSSHNQDVLNGMGTIRAKWQSQMNHMMDHAVNPNAQNAIDLKERMDSLFERQKEDLRRLAELEERNKVLLLENQEKIEDENENIRDSMQKTQDLIDEDKQKAQEQKLINKQEEDDQKQRMEDLHNS